MYEIDYLYEFLNWIYILPNSIKKIDNKKKIIVKNKI